MGNFSQPVEVSNEQTGWFIGSDKLFSDRNVVASRSVGPATRERVAMTGMIFKCLRLSSSRFFGGLGGVNFFGAAANDVRPGPIQLPAY